MTNEETTSFPPQRQSPIGVLVEMLYSLQALVKSLWPLLIFLFLRFTEISLFYKITGFSLFILYGLILGFLKYRNFLFSIDEEREEFIVQSGVINKKRSVVQLNKIQQVSINQSFIQKLVGVYGVEIETAGSIKNEVTIKAISKDEALKIKTRLLSSNQKVNPEHHSTEAQQPNFFIKISLLSLFKAGITSHYLESAGLLIAFFYTIFSNLKDFGFFKEGEEKLFFTDLLSTNGLHFAVIVVAVLIVITLLFNVIRIMVVYYNFHISRMTDSLLLTYGLFNNKSTMINPKKVQIIRLSSNYFQKKFNIFQLSIHQASSDIARDKKANIHVPGCSKTENDSILAFIYGKAPKKGLQVTPSKRKILEPILLFMLIPILTFAVAIAFRPILGSYLYFLLPYFAIVIPAIYFSYRNYRLFIHENFIIKQSGIWDIKTEIIEPHKIQAISTKQNFWHQKSNIGHVTLHTAGGDISFKLSDYTFINKHVNYWLFQVETSTNHWM